MNLCEPLLKKSMNLPSGTRDREQKEAEGFHYGQKSLRDVTGKHLHRDIKT